jgi:hypothetical protein
VERAEYLKAVDPWTFPVVEGCPDPPPEWVAAAWDTAAVQENLVYVLAREVSKNETMNCSETFLGKLSAVLRTEQVVRLFLAIRDRSPHREAEFRPEFERGFTQHVTVLPPPLTPREVVVALGAFGLDEATAAELMGKAPPANGIGD